MARFLGLGTLALLLATSAQSAEPRSAIPWLSESVRNPVMLDSLQPLDPGNTAKSITASAISDIDRDALGLITPQVAGLPADLWGNSPKDRIVDLILSHPQGGVPATKALFRQILLTSTQSPQSDSGTKNLLLARIDRLMGIGALDDAEALLMLAGVPDQQSYRRMVDIGLLTGRADPVCEKFTQTPNIAPTLPIRVFCLARANDWSAAALTLSLGIEIGAIPTDQGELLTMFLDPSLFEDNHEPSLPANLSAFDFVIRESLALPRPTENLPAAFLQVDLVRDTPMRMRIEAAEKLIRSGAISHTQLFAAYRVGKPAASGGIWDRAAAVQQMDQALALGDRDQIVNAFASLVQVAQGIGLDAAIAREYADQLSQLPPGKDSVEIPTALLLAGDFDHAEQWHLTRMQKAALHLALGQNEGSINLDPFETAIFAAFSETPDMSEHGQILMQHLANGENGDALLGALAMLSDDSPDPRDLTAALHVLNLAGLGPQARRIAVETLLLSTQAI